MPPRGERQGFKIGRNGRRYWIASQARRAGTLGFPDATIELPGRGPLPSLDETATDKQRAEVEQINELCAGYTARLIAWIHEQGKIAAAEGTQETRTRYDGTVRSGCRIFQEHKLSPFNTRFKFNTQKTCISFLKLIEATAGHHMFRNVTVPLVQSWYEDWRAPDFNGDDEHVKRAHEGVSTLRQVVYFLTAMRKYDGVSKLAAELQLVQFEKPQARTQEITYEQAVAFCKAAEQLAAIGKMPAERALHMQIGVMSQFDLMLREKDVIGEWAPAGAKRRLPPSITVLDRGAEAWAGYYTWENLHGWRWIMRTSKSRFREIGDFQLENYSLLFPLLERVPHSERTGAIVKGEHGLPMRARSYSNWFREIAIIAKLPRDVWKMDGRAGGAGEAKRSGAKLDDIQDALTHKTPAMTRRYIRSGRADGIAAVASARAASRPKSSDPV
jgi:hypothetical protein